MSCAKLEVKHRLTPVEKEDMLTMEQKIELVTPNPSPRVDPFTVCGPRGMTTARRRLPELLLASAEMRLGVRLRVRHRRFWHSGVVYLFCLGYREVGYSAQIHLRLPPIVKCSSITIGDQVRANVHLTTL